MAVYHNPFTRVNKDVEIMSSKTPFSVRFSTTDIIIDNPIKKRKRGIVDSRKSRKKGSGLGLSDDDGNGVINFAD